MFGLLKDNQSSPFSLAQCCAKAKKDIQGGASLTIFVTNCLLERQV